MILPTQSQHSSQRVPRHIIHSLQHEQFPSDGRHWHNSCSTTTTQLNTDNNTRTAMKHEKWFRTSRCTWELWSASENLIISASLQLPASEPSKPNIIHHKCETLTWMRHLLTSLAHRALLQAKAREKLDRRRRNTDEDDEDEGCITTRTEPNPPDLNEHRNERLRQTQ